MKIKEVTWRLHSDFYATYECEHCGASEEGAGYEDANFHRNVIPEMVCKNCGAKRGGTVAGGADFDVRR